MPIEILVEVKGGCVIGVYCNDPNATVEILDRDAAEDLDEVERLEARIDELSAVG